MSDTVPTPARYTAAQIADRAGVSKVSVLKRLTGIASTGVRLISGKAVQAWSYDILPVALRERIVGQANRCGLSATEFLEAQNGRIWQPPAPLDQLAEHAVERASKLQRALLPSLARLSDRSLTCAEKESLGCREYSREFGYSITPRYLRELIARTLRRAAGLADFTRLELFLDKRPARKPVQETASPKGDDSLSDLAKRMEAFRDHQPTDVQVQLLWDCALESFDSLTGRGWSRRNAKQAVLAVLHTRLDCLAKSANALRVQFDWKYDRWLGSARSVDGLEDGRRERKSTVSQRLTDNEWRWLLTYGTKADNIELGWREFLESPHATPETKQTYAPEGVVGLAPRWVHKKFRLPVRNLQSYVRGPRTAKLNGAYIERDPDTLAAGDSDQSDDKTPDCYWWEDTPEGMWLGQGQLLVWIDERSWLIYNIALITDGAYSGFSIRNSWTNKVEAFGLPRERVSVERGIWQKARVFAGRRSDVAIEQTELGIRRLGIKLRHANYPKGKLIERLFGSLTDLLQLEPGYAGRNQPVDKFERIQQQLKLCRRERDPEHPSRFFLSKAQWMERFLALAGKLNNTPKDGKYHLGRTPKQVFEEEFTTPLVKLPREFRQYCASNLIEGVLVGRNGVQFQFGRQKFTYKNSYELGRLKGERVAVWFSPENPSFCSITHASLDKPIVVEREQLCSHKATADELARAHASCATFDAYHKELYRSLQPQFRADFQARMFRPLVTDHASIEFCRETEGQKSALEARRRDGQKLHRRAARASQQLGMELSPGLASRPGVLEAREELAQLMSEDDDGQTTEDPK